MAVVLLPLVFVTAAQSSTARIRSIKMCASLVTIAMWVLVPAVTTGLLEGDTTLTLNRGLQLFSGVSPFAPVILVLAIISAWPAMQSRRAATPTLARIPREH